MTALTDRAQAARERAVECCEDSTAVAAQAEQARDRHRETEGAVYATLAMTSSGERRLAALDH